MCTPRGSSSASISCAAFRSRRCEQTRPILGTDARAADIANTSSTCPWNPDMYGVDMSKPGGQEYYDSLFDLYASWGVDFVKVDDISRPYDDEPEGRDRGHS